MVDLDLQKQGGGIGHPDPEKTGGAWSQNFFFQFFPDLGASVWSKNKGGRGWGEPPLDLPGTFLAIDPTQRIFHVCK